MDGHTEPTTPAEPLKYQLTFHPTDGSEPIALPPIDFRLFWEATSVVADIGIDRVVHIIQFADALARNLYAQQVDAPEQTAIDILASLPQLISMKPAGAAPTYRIDDHELTERVLSFTYKEIQKQQMSYTRAAEMASSLLETPFTADAWRKRVTRWANTKGHAPPAAKQGRPPKKTGHTQQ
jgi:hypothetical protein